MNSSADWVGAILIFATGLFWGGLVGAGISSDRHRQHAIEAGVAYWAVNPTTGDTTFTFRTPVSFGGTNFGTQHLR